MNQFCSADEINYGALFEFFEEANISFSQPNSDSEQINFAFRFNIKDGRAIVELIQYGKSCRNFIFPVPLDGDPMVIDSFLRGFRSQKTRYSIESDIVTLLKEIPPERFPYEYEAIRMEVTAFESRLSELLSEFEKKFEDRCQYYQQMETRYMNGCYDLPYEIKKYLE